MQDSRQAEKSSRRVSQKLWRGCQEQGNSHCILHGTCYCLPVPAAAQAIAHLTSVPVRRQRIRLIEMHETKSANRLRASSKSGFGVVVFT
jgi:hypothetical protein